MNIAIKKLDERALLPEYQTEQAAGMDVVACIDETLALSPISVLLCQRASQLRYQSGTRRRFAAVVVWQQSSG